MMKNKKDKNIGYTDSLSTNANTPLLKQSTCESTLYEGIIEAIKTVYDPDFPLIDIYTMGLIYDIKIEKNNSQESKITSPSASANPLCPTNVSQQTSHNTPTNIYSSKQKLVGTIIISMTFTTPQCPSIDMLQEMTIFAVKNKYKEYDVKLNIVREPLRSISMIQDEDFKKMFWDV